MKITLTIDCPGITPGSAEAASMLDALENAWDRGRWALTDDADRKHISHILYKVDRWWFNCEGGETRYMPEEEPKATVDPELFLHLNRMWVSQPVILHALLLYKEARLKENLSTEVVDQVRKEFDQFTKYAGTRMGLDFPKD